MMIVFEGIDRCGKGTHAKRLAEKLSAVLMKYPARGTAIGQLIDRWLHGSVRLGSVVDSDFWHSGDRENALMGQALLLANKIEMQCALKTALRENGRVVADRYTPSAFAYGAADGLDRDWLVEAHSELVRPDLCFLLDITAEESMRRRGRPEDEAYDLNFERLQSAREHYRDIALHGSMVPSIWYVLDASGPVETVAADIDSLVRSHFGVRLP